METKAHFTKNIKKIHSTSLFKIRGQYNQMLYVHIIILNDELILHQ